MARIQSGHLLLDTGERILINNAVVVDHTTISGVVDVYATLYFGDGSNLTGVPRAFLDTTDTPTVYSGSEDSFIRVKQDETGVEFGYYNISGEYYTPSEIDTISGSLQAEIDAVDDNITALAGVDARGVATIASGIDNIYMVFDTPFISADYIISIDLSNTVDDPTSIYLQGIEDKTTDGFTVRLSGNTDSANYNLEWLVVASGIDNPLVGGRAVFGSSYNPNTNVVDYVTIATVGDATDFGDLTQANGLNGATSNGNNNRGVFAGAQSSTNIIDYVTIITPSNALDFGDLTLARGYLAGTSNGTNERGVFGGGSGPTDTIDYITISTPSDAVDFGNLTLARTPVAATSNATNERGVFAGGVSSDIIDYITISSISNATDFGDLTAIRSYSAGLSNGITGRGIFAGGTGTGGDNHIQYITISTPGNATDFGDLTENKHAPGATSNGVDDRGVIAGNSSDSNIIDYITISVTANAVNFGDLTVGRGYLSATSND